MNTLDALAERTSTIAMQGAADALRARGIDNPDYDAVTAAIRRRVRESFREAMDDAREALACGMRAAAETTWAATFRIAGIDAVTDVYPVETVRERKVV